MKIFAKLDHDHSAKVTLQMSAAEFQALHEYMHTPKESTSIKFPNAVYLHKVGFGWYKLSTSNDYLPALKFTSAVKLIRKSVERIAEAKQVPMIAEFITSQVPFPLGVPFKPVVPTPVVRVPDDKPVIPVKHLHRRVSPLLSALFSRA